MSNFSDFLCNFRISFALSFIICLVYFTLFHSPILLHSGYALPLFLITVFFRWQSPIISESDHFMSLSLRTWHTSSQHKHHRTRQSTSSRCEVGKTRSCSAGTPRLGLQGESGARYGCSGWEGGRGGRGGRGRRGAQRTPLVPSAGERHRRDGTVTVFSRFSFVYKILRAPQAVVIPHFQ